jgi:hypothetical protein
MKVAPEKRLQLPTLADRARKAADLPAAEFERHVAIGAERIRDAVKAADEPPRREPETVMPEVEERGYDELVAAWSAANARARIRFKKEIAKWRPRRKEIEGENP